MSRSLLRPLTALATLLVASSAAAAEWHVVDEPAQLAKGASAVAESPRAAAEGYLTRAAGKLRLEGVSLAFHEALDASAFRTVRFTQQHGGLPVLGGGAALRLTPGGQVRVAVLDVARDLSVSTTPSVDQATAIAATEAALGEALTEEPAVSLAVQPQHGTPGRLVWVVDGLQGTRRATRFVVDAHTGELVRRQSLVHDALGRVYPISSVVTPQTQDVTLGSLVVSSPQRLNGWNGNLTVTNYSSGNSYNGFSVDQSLGPSDGQDFLHSPPPDGGSGTDGFAQVMLYHHLTRAKDFFTSSMGVNMSPASWKVTAVANAMEDWSPMDNAFFSPGGITGPYASPNLIAIGQGSQVDFSVDSDVFIHEFGHYVSHNAVGYNNGQGAYGQYGLTPWGGAIDEGIADYFACTMNEDPVLGEASLAPFGAQRDLSDTSKRCPDDTVGEVHYDGEIVGSLGWSAREAFGVERGDQLVWGAVSMLTPNPSMSDFARGLQATADELVAQGSMTAQDRQVLENLIIARGMNDCDHVLDVSAQKPRTFINMGLDFFGQLLGGSCQQVKQQYSLHSFFHLKVVPNPGDTSVKFKVDLEPQGAGEMDWGIYVQVGQSVAISSSDLHPQNAAYRIEHLTGTQGELVIDANSSPPFDPSQTYYMVIGDQNCPASRVTVTSDTQGPPPVTTTGVGGGGGGGGGQGGDGQGGAGGNTGGGDDDDDGGGSNDTACDCTAAGGGQTAPWAALAGLGLAAAAVIRRRRRG